MMILWRVFGWPFGLVYGSFMLIRRLLFNAGILRRNTAAIPVIVAGNLTVGGTGKTPFVVWLTGALSSRNPAVLSRGYGRKSSGFEEVTQGLPVSVTGDEPAEIQHRFAGRFRNYVCEDRLEGVKRILSTAPDTGVVILDDGFQHLSLLPQATVLLCDYHRPFYHDFPMPAGRLREFAFTARQATCIVVTKCPVNFELQEAMSIRQKLSKYGRPVFFAQYKNSPPLNEHGKQPDPALPLVAVSGLASHAIFQQWAGKYYRISKSFAYRDHAEYTETEIDQWGSAVDKSGAQGILTTGKDAVKIRALVPPFAVFETHTEPEILFDGETDLIHLLLRQID